MVRQLLLPICMVWGLASASAQSFAPEVWATAGNHYASANLSVTWTLGETVIETYTEPTLPLMVTQGFNQPFLEAKTTSIGVQPQDISTVFSVSPNPTSGIIRIKLNQPFDKPLQVALYNTLGQLIQQDLWLPNAAAPAMEMSLENLANGVYFLQVSMGGESLGVYKVQKDHH